MAVDPALPTDEIERRLAERQGWTVEDGRLHREVQFAGFVEAFSFMTAVAIEAERLNHHPDWSNSWNRVVIDVVSHAAGGITERCFDLAAAVDRHASGRVQVSPS